MHACGHPIGEELLGGDHRFAVDGDGVGGVGFDIGSEPAASQPAESRTIGSLIAGEHQIDREVHEPHVALDDDREQVDQAFDIRAPGEPRVELAGAQCAVAGAVEHRLELVLVEQRPQPAVVFGVAGDDAVAGERPVVFLANGDDLARITRAEVVKRVVARHAGDAGDQKRQRNRIRGRG